MEKRLQMARRRLGRQGGTAVVEFALVLPMLLLILLGIIDFSLALYDKSVITHAAREGARAGIVLRNPKLTTNEIRQVVLSHTNNALLNLGGSEVPVVTVVQSNPASFPNPLSVSVSYTFRGIGIGSLFASLGSPIVLNAAMVMVNE